MRRVQLGTDSQSDLDRQSCRGWLSYTLHAVPGVNGVVGSPVYPESLVNGDSIPQWLQCCSVVTIPREVLFYPYPQMVGYIQILSLQKIHPCWSILLVVFPFYSEKVAMIYTLVIIYIYYLYISYTLYRSIMFHLPFLMKP